MLDWKTFHPRGNWVVVKADPRVKTTKGGIELPDQQLAIERVMEGTGRLLKIGSDKEAVLNATGGVMLEPGMRICFRGFLKDAFHEFSTDEDGLTVFLLRADDILAVLDDDVQMGAFSG